MKRLGPLGFVCILHALSCGYGPVYSAQSTEHLAVTLVSARTSDAVSSDEVVAGVRDTLAKEGALAPGSSYPRVEIEVLREDEASEGIVGASAPSGHVPVARATEVGIVARGWIVRAAFGAREADTGDMRSFDLVGAPSDGSSLAAEALRHDDALRATARRLGQRLALRLLGHPVAVQEER